MIHTGSGFEIRAAGAMIDGRRVLEPLSLRLRPGRVCGIIGRNAAGKSSLLRLLAGQLRPDGGAVLLDGEPLAARPPRDLARLVAHMPQAPTMPDGMAVRDLVALGRYPWHGALGRRGEADAAAIGLALERTGLLPLADRDGATLSGGERQRVWLALMLAQEARWLLLDEPSSALDLVWALDLLDHLRRLTRDSGIGVAIALHDMNLAARFCDDIVALNDGACIAHGPVEEVFVPETLERVFDVPMRIIRYEGRIVALPDRGDGVR